MTPSERDRGFTLVELLVVIALLGVMMALAVGGWRSWSRASQQSGTAQEVESKVRVLGPFRTRSPDVHLTAPQFTSYAGVVSTGVTFRARGTAWAGKVQVTREGSPKAYTITVERLTGRVEVG